MPGKNKTLFRYLEKDIKRLIKDGYSALILGPRQVGKTTLVKECLKKDPAVVEYPLQNPSVRLQFEADPGRLIREIQGLEDTSYVFIDEAQKVPPIFDAVQWLIDNKIAHFILTGSSARKLRRKGVNLLPGRVKYFHLDPLLWGELGLVKGSTLKQLNSENVNEPFGYSLEDSLVYGSLPAIVSLPEKDRLFFLSSYSQIYLEEEIRAEALSRKIGAFSRFLELAAIEAGTSPNLTKLSNESGVSQPAIKEFYQILEDTLIVERVDPYLKNARKRIFSSPRYFFFDLGVRNRLARFPLTKEFINAQKGSLFEQAVILEIIKRARVLGRNYKICFWRTSGGAEVDCIIDMGNQVIPIEIKASVSVSLAEVRGLRIFLNDYQNLASEGYVITMGERKEKLSANITIIPWFYL